MIQEKEYLEAKRIVTLYECQQLNISGVIKSVCEKCRFKAECRYKEMNTEQNCKYFIDEQRFAALCRWGIKARKYQPTTKLN